MGTMRKIWAKLDEQKKEWSHHPEIKKIAAGAGTGAAVGTVLGLASRLNSNQFALLVTSASFLGGSAVYLNEKRHSRKVESVVSRGVSLELEKVASPRVEAAVMSENHLLPESPQSAKTSQDERRPELRRGNSF